MRGFARHLKSIYDGGIFERAAGAMLLGVDPVMHALQLGTGALHLYTGYQERKKQFNRLKVVYNLIEVFHSIQELASTHSITSEFNDIEYGREYKKFIKNLEDLVCADKGWRIFNFDIDQTYMQFYRVYKPFLSKLLWAIGEWDAYLAIADKMLSQGDNGSGQSKSPSFCYAEFYDSVKPFVHAENYWYIALDKKQMKNTITARKNVIITGPNARGKTTAVRVILQNLSLAQSFGIAAGTKFVCTPFHHIASYLSKSDDVAKRKSLLETEVDKLDNAIHILDRALSENNEKVFIAVDEPLTGTKADEAEVNAFGILEKAGDHYPNGLLICTTHYKKLTDLAETGKFINYCVDDNFHLGQGINLNYTIDGTIKDRFNKYYDKQSYFALFAHKIFMMNSFVICNPLREFVVDKVKSEIVFEYYVSKPIEKEVY